MSAMVLTWPARARERASESESESERASKQESKREQASKQASEQEQARASESKRASERAREQERTIKPRQNTAGVIVDHIVMITAIVMISTRQKQSCPKTTI